MHLILNDVGHVAAIAESFERVLMKSVVVRIKFFGHRVIDKLVLDVAQGTEAEEEEKDDWFHQCSLAVAIVGGSYVNWISLVSIIRVCTIGQ